MGEKINNTNVARRYFNAIVSRYNFMKRPRERERDRKSGRKRKGERE